MTGAGGGLGAGGSGGPGGSSGKRRQHGKRRFASRHWRRDRGRRLRRGRGLGKRVGRLRVRDWRHFQRRSARRCRAVRACLRARSPPANASLRGTGPRRLAPVTRIWEARQLPSMTRRLRSMCALVIVSGVVPGLARAEDSEDPVARVRGGPFDAHREIVSSLSGSRVLEPVQALWKRDVRRDGRTAWPRSGDLLGAIARRRHALFVAAVPAAYRHRVDRCRRRPLRHGLRWTDLVPNRLGCGRRGQRGLLCASVAERHRRPQL